MLHKPVEERFFKANVMSGLFTFDPFVPEDFLPLLGAFSEGEIAHLEAVFLA